MNIIVAVDTNWGIGYSGTQPLVISEDRRHFRELTSGKTVITGRRTLEDFPGGKPLKNRQNIILSSKSDFRVDGAVVVHNLRELRETLTDLPEDEVFIIGGESVYRLLLPYCHRAYVTQINAAPPADRYFPNLDTAPEWVIEECGETYLSGDVRYRFVTYKNIMKKELEQ